MIQFILSFIGLTMLSVALTHAFEIRLSKTLPLGFMIVMVVLYCASIVNVLSLGVYILYLGSAIACLYLLFHFKDVLSNPRIRNGTLYVYLIFLGVFLAINIFTKFTRWDEFSHWGLIVKNMQINKALPSLGNSTVSFMTYPPGMALIQIYFVYGAESVREALIYVSTNLFKFSLLLVLLDDLEIQSKKFYLTLLGLLAIPVAFFPNYYQSIYVDEVLAVLFVYAIVQIYKPKNTFDGSVLLAVISLTLIKDSGLGLAIAIVLLVAFKQKNLFNGIIYGFFVFLFKMSWQTHLKWEQIVVEKSSTVPGLIDVVLGNGKEYQYTVISEFIKSNWITFVLLAVLLIIVFGRARTNRERSSDSLRVIVTLSTITFVYYISVLYMYMFIFTEYEAVQLASMSRYTSTILMPLVLIVFVLMVGEFNSLSRAISRRERNIIVSTIVIYMTYSGIQSFLISEGLRNILAQDIKEIKSNDVSKIYFIDNEETGYWYWVMRYELTPIPMNQPFTWSLKLPGSTKTPWDCEMTLDQFKSLIVNDNYSHMYIKNDHDILLSEYAALFADPVRENALYKIEADGLLHMVWSKE